MDIMLSSTVADLMAERDAVIKALAKFPFVTTVGAAPVAGKTHSSSPLITTIKMAEACSFYILLLGDRFGFEYVDGRSATEIEFDAAYHVDPTKILVFQKEATTPEAKQLAFIKKVSDYQSGYWVTRFRFTHDLQSLVESSFIALLEERAAVGGSLGISDHFVRLAIQRKPTTDCQVEYSSLRNSVQLMYIFSGKSHTIEFEKLKVNRSFWACVSELDLAFARWIGA